MPAPGPGRIEEDGRPLARVGPLEEGDEVLGRRLGDLTRCGDQVRAGRPDLDRPEGHRLRADHRSRQGERGEAETDGE